MFSNDIYNILVSEYESHVYDSINGLSYQIANTTVHIEHLLKGHDVYLSCPYINHNKDQIVFIFLKTGLPPISTIEYKG